MGQLEHCQLEACGLQCLVTSVVGSLAELREQVDPPLVRAEPPSKVDQSREGLLALELVRKSAVTGQSRCD
jgi:hypothetical protein